MSILHTCYAVLAMTSCKEDALLHGCSRCFAEIVHGVMQYKLYAGEVTCTLRGIHNLILCPRIKQIGQMQVREGLSWLHKVSCG